jgi:hypothetical protein
MPYLGRQGALAPLTSADIPAGIVEGTDVAFLENSSGQNLGGTYSTERMYLSGRTGSAPNDYNYKLTGNVTVTGHLALGTIADADVVITNDGTARTLTGGTAGGATGTLEAGGLLAEESKDLTGMTGELGSGVTLGSGVDLDTAFPYTSSAQNLGKLRFITGSVTTNGSSTGNSSSYYYGDVGITYSGFNSKPNIYLTIEAGYHDSHVMVASTPTTTSASLRLSCPREAGVQSQIIKWIAVGTAS